MNIGDYVRTEDGFIRKIIKIDKLIYVDKDFISSEPEYHDSFIEEEIIKSSPQIIDLIEVGDYVNGYQVIEKPYTYHDIQFISVDTQDSWKWGKGEMPVDEIKSIVTHEQMEAMQYRVEE